MENFVYAGKCLDKGHTLFKFYISESFFKEKVKFDIKPTDDVFLVVLTGTKYKILSVDDIMMSFIVNNGMVYSISLTRLEVAKLIKSIKDYIQLRSLMLNFNYTGASKEIGDWRIVRGGETLLWSLNYKGKRVIDCVLNELQNAGTSEFQFTKYGNIIINECVDCYFADTTHPDTKEISPRFQTADQFCEVPV